jgi:hypothetical protein
MMARFYSLDTTAKHNTTVPFLPDKYVWQKSTKIIDWSCSASQNILRILWTRFLMACSPNWEIRILETGKHK